ncbi:hypothetical protein [Salinicola lusitanus]|uniref:hypothetical protein n=1 Tax=Salinicola lusitanus TaxID=1949085 RepID=UPI000DA1FBA1|nr:hypothetical protein [Salinicola lusitanus]
MKKWIAVGVISLLGTTAAQAAPTPYQFGFALQAAAQCDSLQLRIDTEGKVNAARETPIRKSDGFREGLFYVADHDSASTCREAWEKYGCSGSEVPGLIQESPFDASNPKLCEYRG